MNANAPLLIAYDGSPDADLALTWAIRTAEGTGQSLLVVVASLEPSRLPRHVRDYEEAHAELVVENARQAVKEAESLRRSEVVLVRGWTLPVLLGMSAGAAMVITGARGHHRREDRWLGSVSQHLATLTRCPVAVIRPAQNPVARQIVVGVDGSPASVRALDHAARRAELTGESVLAVHAYQVLSLSGGGLGALPADIDTTAIDAAQRLAAELIAGIAIDHPDVVLHSTAVVGRAARVLTRLSDDASLVVIGSRGRTPVQELLLGSVSQEVLHRAACPVVVIR